MYLSSVINAVTGWNCRQVDVYKMVLPVNNPYKNNLNNFTNS